LALFTAFVCGASIIMDQLEPFSVQCPHCWQPIDINVDASAASQTYVEDCQVCCRPMVITVTVEDGEVVSVDAAPEY